MESAMIEKTMVNQQRRTQTQNWYYRYFSVWIYMAYLNICPGIPVARGSNFCPTSRLFVEQFWPGHPGCIPC